MLNNQNERYNLEDMSTDELIKNAELALEMYNIFVMFIISKQIKELSQSVVSG